MNLPAGIPLAADAPPLGATVRIERPEAGLAVLVFDPPNRKLPVFDMVLMRDFDRALSEIESDRTLSALVITGRDPTTFVAGADIDVIASVTDERIALELARFGQTLFQRVAKLRVRTVAAVGGPVPGGACELSLACNFIVLADHPSTRIGLPEVRLGILPGWGGTQRLPRRIGTAKALDAILTGKLFAPKDALRSGLVDRLAFPEYLRRVASELALGRGRVTRKERSGWSRFLDKNSFVRSIITKKATEKVLKETHGHYPAPLEALRLAVGAQATPLDVGLANEAEALARLAVSPVCKNLVTIFKLSEEAKKLGKLADGRDAATIARVGVIGAGVMGAGIAVLAAEKGFASRLSDVARAPLDLAVLAHRKSIGKQLAKRRIERYQADAAIDRLEVATGLAGFERCELVVEAVVERLDVKQKVLGELAAHMAPDAILATNTSSLSVDAIAAGLTNPERVVGMHFFNPVAQMPLVEVVRGAKTSNEVVAAVAKLALKLGKTPVVTRDVAGFLVNRLLGPYLDEAARLFEAGVECERIDRLAREFGMPMGPLELIDEVGLDIASHAAKSLAQAYGDRMSTSSLIDRALELGWKGKKGSKGFYLYAPDEKTGRVKKLGFNPEMLGCRAPARVAGDHSDAGILDQLLLSMLNEAARCLEEAVVETPRELDLASVFGMGFAPFRGGLLRWADTLGAKEIVARLRRIADAPDVLARREGPKRFLPADLVLSMAESGGRFHAR